MSVSVSPLPLASSSSKQAAGEVNGLGFSSSPHPQGYSHQRTQRSPNTSRRPSLSPRVAPVVNPSPHKYQPLPEPTPASPPASAPVVVRPRKSSDAYATTTPGSKSAPTSPSGRAQSGMLAPLSQITPIYLDERLRGAAGALPAFEQRSAQMQNLAPALGLALAQSNQQQHQQLSSQYRSQTLPQQQQQHFQQLPNGAAAGAYRTITSQPVHSQIPQSQPASIRHAPAAQPGQPPYRSVSNSQAASSTRPNGTAQMTPGRSSGSTSHSRSRSRHAVQRPLPSGSSSSSSASETETEVDSDSTFVPGRASSTARKQASQSQPNLLAMRNRLEGWAGDVARERSEAQAAANQRPTPHRQNSYTGSKASGGVGRKTPPSRPAPLYSASGSGTTTVSPRINTSNLPSRSPTSRSQPLLQGRKSPSQSPRSSTASIPTMTPVIARSGSRSASTSPGTPLRPLGGVTSSEDGDDDYDGGTTTDSLSSDSLSFSPRRRRRSLGLGSAGAGPGGIRNRFGQADRGVKGLGLSLDAETSDGEHASAGVLSGGGAASSLDLANKLGDAQSTLFNLRLLALWPAILGSMLLIRAIIGGGVWLGSYPFGLDLSKEALDSVILGRAYEGIWLPAHRGDLLLCLPWAALTGQLCFDLTTGLTYRWRLYYDKLATVTRLLSIQCICQPLTFLTLWTLGPSQILFAWVVIGCTTAASRAVQMYVTSNIVRPGGSANPSADRGDVTPNAARRTRGLPRVKGDRAGSRSGSEDPDAKPPGGKKAAKTGRLSGTRKAWAEFRTDRKWDWDALAREVGWKLGALLLITNAWLFLGIHGGRFVEL